MGLSLMTYSISVTGGSVIAAANCIRRSLKEKYSSDVKLFLKDAFCFEAVVLRKFKNIKFLNVRRC
jgi:hypothetical protein